MTFVDPTGRYVALDYQTAKHIIVANHYSHSCPSISWAWGIKEGENILGVLTIGKVCRSSTMSEGVVGKNRADDVYELNRVWLSDALPVVEVQKGDKIHRHGEESRFIGWCLRAIRHDYPNRILVSYADTEAHDKKTHVFHRCQTGGIYQATNWVYTGCTAAIADWAFPSDEARGRDRRDSAQACRGALVKPCPGNGGPCCRNLTKMSKHDTVTCECGYEWAKGVGGGKRPWVCLVPKCKWHSFGEKALKTPRTRKHRYVWFANPADRALLKWAVLPYPKRLDTAPCVR
jgi:hypothetical protein